jgi:hypothetical protein
MRLVRFVISYLLLEREEGPFVAKRVIRYWLLVIGQIEKNAGENLGR